MLAVDPVDRAARTPLEPLVREWLLDLEVGGRSPQTLRWYRDKWTQYWKRSGVRWLEEFTGQELKLVLAGLHAEGRGPNTIHGYFQVLRSFANWAVREGYEVDGALLRARPPKLPQTEMESFNPVQLQALLQNAPDGWPLMAVQILLGTGMRLGELCALRLDDVEDEEEALFLRIKRGKGAKFRRVPVSRRLRRELYRYINRRRPDSKSPELLLLPDGRPVQTATVSRFFQRLRDKVGFRVHAHKFRHTFATEYLRQGGEIERLRRILGHTTYTMVMRYVHLDKGDLVKDIDLRSPF